MVVKDPGCCHSYMHMHQNGSGHGCVAVAIGRVTVAMGNVAVSEKPLGDFRD